MSHYSIEVEFLAGTEITTCYNEAVALCRRMDCVYVKFSFNGIKVSVGKNKLYFEEEIKDMLTRAFKEDSKHLIIN